MKYWNFPAHGSGSHGYTDPDDYNNYGTLIDPSYGYLSTTYNTWYDWNNMPVTATTTNTGIPRLMYDNGVGVSMNYSANGSGAYFTDIIEAITNHFYYSTDAHLEDYTSYSVSQWVNMLKTEMDNGRPVLYDGHEPGGGHTWVCDGYQDNYNGTGNTYVHMNWGWSGGSNGYFLVSNLNPGGNNFVSTLRAIFNIHPTYQVPMAPTNVTASQGTYGGKIHVSWRWASNASHYQVYRSSTNNSSTATSISTWQTGLSYDDFTMVPNQNQYYWVKSATSAAGANASGFSEVAIGYCRTEF